MGEYTEPSAFELPAEQTQIETKMGACYFPLLTDGVLIEKNVSPTGSNNNRQTTLIDLGRLASGERLRAFCIKHNLEVSTLFQFVWSVVLSSYLGSENVSFIVVKSRSDRHEVGVCEVETENESIVLDALRVAEKVVKRSYVTYDRTASSRFPIPVTTEGRKAFNSMVIYEKLGGVSSVTDAQVDYRDNDFVSVVVRETLLQVEIELSYPSSFLPKAQAQNVASTFSQALLEIIQRPQQRISEMDLVGPAQLSQIWEWNKEMPKAVSKRVNDLIEGQALRRPGAPAVIAEDGDFTYSVLSDLSNRLAHHLIALGVGPESVVPLCFEKSKWAIVAMVAVIKAGAAIVNLDANQPMARLNGLLDQINSPLVLTSQKNEMLWKDRMMVFVVDQANITKLAQRSRAPVTPATPNNILYVIFTSGSTGTPKGCVIEHESFLTAAMEHVKAARISEDSRIFQGTPYTFDVSMLEIFTALSTGACVCSCGDELMKTGVANVIRTLGITWTFMTPSLVRLIEPQDVPSLKTLALGGEALSAMDVRTWADKVHLVNGYGPTETSVAATINAGISRETDPLNIGRGAGALCWVVKADDHHSLVPIGAVGELMLQGPIVARGYYQNKGKTQEVFIDELPAFATKLPSLTAMRFYKTGDLVRYNSDGTITFIGRKDGQIKLRGQRLELGEIEHHLNVDSHVRHGIVVLPKKGRCQEKLVAVLSLHDFPSASANPADINVIKPEYKAQSRILAAEIRERIRPHLTTYMLPTAWLILEALPLTTSGKINGRAVTTWLENVSKEVYNEIADVAALTENEKPTTDMEEVMQKIWSEVLNIPTAEIGLSRSFISIGGDSITAMKVISRCRAQNIILAVKDIFQGKNLVEVAARAVLSNAPLAKEVEYDTSGELSVSERVSTITPEVLSMLGLSSTSEVEDVFICSPMQESIVLTRARFPGTYEVQKVIMLESADSAMLQAEHIRNAWQKVVDRHQSLRTVIINAIKGIPGGAVFHQVVLKQAKADIIQVQYNGEITNTKISSFLKNCPGPIYGNSKPEHRLTICKLADGRSALLVDVSHAVVDGISAETILRDLALALEGQLPTKSGPLYSDYIAHIQRLPEEESLEFWKVTLATSQPTIVPMYGGDKKSEKKSRSTKVAFSEWARLMKFSESNGVTISNVIQTAWALTLKAYTGSEEVLFGFMASGRDLPVADIESTVGVFLTMMVCHLAINEDITATELVQTVQENYVSGHPYQYTPLGKIQNALNMQGMPLFNTIMSLDKLSEQNVKGRNVLLSAIDEVDTCEFDIAVHAYLGDNEINIRLDYWSTILSDGEAANIANTFSGAISAVLNSSEDKVRDLDLFNTRDRQQVWEWNSQEIVAAKGVVHDYFHQQVLAQPDALAVVSWDGEFTYHELDRLSTRLAFYLAYRGVGPEVLVPHCFDKSKWSTVVTVAIMKAGGAGVGLSPSHPKSRLEAVIEECSAKLILVEPQHAHLFESIDTVVIVVDSEYIRKLPGVVSGARLPKVSPSNPAFVSFTSGSTGKPKGIVLEHQSLITSIQAHGSEWDVNPGTRVIQFSAYAFDAAVSDTFTTLTRGGTVCIPSEYERTNDLVGAINRMQVNWAFLTPRVLGTLSPITVPSLKTVVLGGEAISAEDVDPWTADISLRIVYGPTECTIYSMGTDPLTPTSDPTNLGHGVGTRVWITDSKDHDKLAPVGVIGELLIEGPLVTRGYLNDPERTAISFIENPKWMPREAGSPPRRFYKTSDLVRYLPNGEMMFIGRKDTQVKIRGQRVELGEIEHAVVQNFPSLEHVIVDSVVFPQSGQALVAFLKVQNLTTDSMFVPLDEATTVTLRQLEKTLAGCLPTYMVPSLFVPIGYIPMTLTQKVDRKLLKLSATKFTTEEFETYSLSSKHKRAPATGAEKSVQKLWAEVLNKSPETIGADDSFFRLGGDSIAAMKLVTAARAVGITIGVADIFKYAELSKMAAFLGEVEGEIQEAVSEVAPEPFQLLSEDTNVESLLEEVSERYWIAKENIADVYPCTPLQEALVAISTTQPGAYVAQSAFNLPATMDLQRFKDAWQIMVDTHSILRTRVISPVTTRFLQVVLRQQTISWQEASSLEEYLEQDKQRPILYGGELTRYGLFKDEETGHFSFVWTAHHAVYDGWTVPMVLDQVVQIYKDSVLPIEAPFNQFIKHLEAVDPKDSRAFWQSQLSGDLPASFPKLPNPTYQARSTEVMWHEMDMLVKADTGITQAIVLRAAWAIVVARYADSNDVVFGLTLSGRDLSVAGVQQMLGPTITTVPIKVSIDNDMTVSKYLSQTQQQSIDMIPFQHTGLQNIKRVSADAAEAADFKNLFCVQPYAHGAPDFLDMEHVPVDMVGFDTYALLVECNVKDGGIAIKASYDNDVIPGDQVERLLHQFETVVEQLNEQSTTTKISEVDLFSEHDRQQVWDWNSITPTMNDECVTKIFKQQVFRHPKALAIDSWDGKLTYKELDDLSARLAWFLRNNLQVKPEVLVPMCFDKSVWTVVAIVAVVKAGGAYVMLNPEHPVPRLGGLLEDVDSHVLLSAPEHCHLFETLPQTATPVNEAFIKSLPKPTMQQISQLRIEPHHPAVMVFTSGSTGKPKGILLQHNSLCTVSTQHGGPRGLGFGGKGSRVLQFATYTFDASVAEIFFTLMHGGTICIITEYDRINNLAGIMRSMEITWTFLTPTVAALVDPEDVPTLKTIVLGGEALPRALIDKWAAHVRTLNSYGPSECTIWTSHIETGPDLHSSNIGFGYGSRLWVVEPSDHNRLTPVGCIGELIIEGPIVARGYLKEPEKTKAVFIDSPVWMEEGSSATHRLYKTGDLVRYTSDGSLIIVGRKDTQVKFHGQRIELGEIEFHIQSQPEIEIVMVSMPKLGLCKGKLVAAVAITEFDPQSLEGESVALVDQKFKEKAQSIVSDIKVRLAEKLPPYMIPSTWMVLNGIPRTPSGKLNRVPITRWINNMSKEEYLEVADATAAKNEKPTNSMEKQLIEVVSIVLDIPAVNIGANRSFLSLGGDSITAMQMVSRCRALKISLGVEDILKSKSLAEMATKAKMSAGPVISKDEQFDTLFELSPVQQLYFRDVVSLDANPLGGTQYNQNLLARFTRHVKEAELAYAVTKIVKLHSMLRASFKQDKNGKWMQSVSRNTTGYRVFDIHESMTRKQMIDLVNKRQTSFDIQKGPVFAVDLFNMKDGSQLVSLCAHHLVIDLVSWRVILQNLEELLESKNLTTETPLPFQTWNRLQIEEAKALVPSKALPVEVPAANLEYWGMPAPPSWKDVEEVSFASSTEPVEILLAVLQQSFRQAFSDREAPAIFCEGHGRETWDSDIDPSGTVGWFTTFNPIHVSGDSRSDSIELVKRTKDIRRKTPKNGWEYFTCRHFSTEGIEAFKHHSDMEICFNYMGRYQQLEKEGALIREEPLLAGEEIKFVGDATRRVAVFDVSAVVTNGQLRFSFFFNRTTQHMDKIHDWVAKCDELIRSTVQELVQSPVQQTLTDFPLMSMDYNGLAEFTNTLKEIGVNSSNVESLYPASNVQEGILISQARSPSTYKVRQLYRVTSNDSSLPIDFERLSKAWQKVVDYHGALRTIFLDTFDQSGEVLYDQLVLKETPANVKFMAYEGTGSDVVAFIESQPAPEYTERRPPHRITLCEASDGIYMHLEISHSIVDGTSLAVVMRDFTAAYQDLLPSGTGPLYSDFVKYLQHQNEADTMGYWSGYLGGIEPCYFPSLRDGPPVAKSPNPTSLMVNLAIDVDLDSFCKEHEITVGNVMQAAWGLVLKLYTGSSKVCFGHMTSGRDVPVENVYDAVGPYINLLVANLDFSTDTGVGELLKQLQDDYLTSLPHQHAALGKIQKELGNSGVKLFNTFINLQRLPPPGPEPKIALEIMGEMDPTDYELSLYITTGGPEIELVMQYLESHIPADRAMAIVNTFGTILKGLLASYDKTVGSLDFISEQDKNQIKSWNRRGPRFVDNCVHSLIAEHAIDQPNEQAVVSWEGDATFTYAELDQAALRLAQYLRTLGVGSEVLVPLCFRKSSWSIVTILAVLKAGGAYVMLSPTDSRKRIENVLIDTAASMVIVSPEYASQFSGMGLTVISIDDSSFEQLPAYTGFVADDVDSTNAAMVLYAAEGTDEPRGTVLEHRSISTKATKHGPTVSMTPRATVLQLAPYTSGISNSEILSTLINGGCICIPSDDERVNDISGAINRMDVNWAFFTPTVAKFIDPSTVPSLQTLVLGGEPVSAPLLQKWQRVQTVNSYGLSEASVWSSNAWQKRSGAVSASNIGRGIASRMWVVEPANHNRLVPVGGIGELLIDGPLVARGYLGNHGVTQTAFITAPMWLQQYDETAALSESTRMFKTGDLVRCNSNGTFDFVGRMDGQVKINSQSINIVELENTIATVLSGSEQVAVGLTTSSVRQGKETLTAFFTDNTATRENVTGQDLLRPFSDDLQKHFTAIKAEIGKLLPQYMMPSLFIPLSSLPLTSAMKLNRQALQDLARSLSEEDLVRYSLMVIAQKKAVSSSKGKVLSAIWAQVLHVPVESIGAADHFFRLGGDSIAAMKMVTVARTKGYQLTVPDIFQNPTLSAMSKPFKKLGQTAESSTATSDALETFSLINDKTDIESLVEVAAKECGIDSSLIEDMYPCTSSQESSMAIYDSSVVSQHAYEIPSTIDLARFRKAWEILSTTAAIMRTRIVKTNEGVFQVVIKQELKWEDSETLEQYLEHDKQIPITYGGPLSRYAIIGKSRRKYMVWTAHKAVSDGFSAAMIAQQVASIYEKDIVAEHVPFNKFIQSLGKVNADSVEPFWRSQLAQESSSYPSLISATYQPRTDKKASRTLQVSRADNEIPVSVLLRAAWAIVVSVYADADDVIFGAQVSGRDAKVEDLQIMGPTSSIVPVQISMDRSKSVADFLRQVKRQAAVMAPYEQTGLENIRQISKEISEALNFQNLLIINRQKQTSDIMGLSRVNLDIEDAHSYSLVIECNIDASAIGLEATWDSNILSAAQVDRIMHQFEHVANQLNAVGMDSPVKLEKIETFTAQDRKQIVEWNTVRPEMLETCVHTLFEEQALKRPGASAVESFDGNFTYAQLNDMATRLAQFLVSQGVKPEDKVPVCYDKSAWVIVAMFGIMKSGGTCVMLNPDNPVERVRGIIEDLGCKMVLCDSPSSKIFTTILPASKIFHMDESFVHNLPTRNMPPVVVPPSNAVLVVYTSGSTGKPKGIVLEHRSIATGLLAHGTQMGMGHHTRTFQFAAYTFDVSLEEIIATLILGGTVCVPSPFERMNDVAGAMTRMRVNWTELTPTVASLLDPSMVPTLRTLALSGESVTKEVVEIWADHVQIVNTYGPSECSVSTSCNIHLSKTRDISNIGTGFGCTLWVVDPADHHRLAPIGGVGELLVEGPIVAREYWNDKEKTEAAFVQDLAWAKGMPGNPKKFYKTGDLVKYNADSSIKFIGRRDTQVKLHGQRIEMGEIEYQVKAALPDSTYQVAVEVITPESRGKNKMLAAFYCKTNATAMGVENCILSAQDKQMLDELMSAIQLSLPAYMVPTMFIPLGYMPLSTSGKLDRKSLRQVANLLSAEALASYSLSVSKHAKAVGTPAPTAGKPVALVEPAYESETVPIDDMPYKPFSTIKTDNVDAFLRIISEKAGVQKNNIIDVLPTTSSQDVAIVGALTDSRWMLNYFYFQGTGPVDLEQVQRSCFELVQSLEALRTVYVLHEGKFMQVVLKSLTPMFSVYETNQDIDAFGEGLYEDSFSRDIALEDPFVQFVVIKQLYSSKHRITMRLSHAQYDEASMPVIWTALQIAFSGQPIPNTPGFSRYASRAHTLNSEGAVQKHWKQILSGSSMTDIISRQAPELRRTSDKVTTLSKTIQAPSLASEGITFATVIKAAWSLTMAQLSSSSDIVFGHTVNGRNLPIDGIENIVGACLNIVPVRVNLQSDWKNIDLLNYVQTQHLNNLAFESMGYRDIIKKCTNWPKWTQYGSVVQHRGFSDEDPTINLGGTNYEPGYMATDLDMVDVCVLSTSLADGLTDISVLSSPSVPIEISEELLELVCKNALGFTTNPHALLAVALPSTQANPILPVAPRSPGSVASSRSFETLDKKDAAALQEVLRRTWTEVLESTAEIKLDSSIFELGGDVINAAQVAVLLREKSFEVSVEDLVRFPTIEGQIDLLSTQARKAKQILG
ncbi:hypothetical protein BGZ60DRAFT_564547 [Tricladium varicosporioides]|nr:hypothetical protein BGZ60DRAFT_564547 [Hymenoscyphus varicosporioides]